METPKFLNLNEFVQPVELKIVPDTPAMERIFALIIEHDGLTLREISQKLCILENTVRTCLHRLLHEGSIKRMPVVAGERRLRWVAGVDERFEQDPKQSRMFQATQRTVYAWEPMKVQQQTPFSALFGEESE
jgi:transposase